MAMLDYYSTRDPNKQGYSFKEALLQGLAPDGGLFVPRLIPKLPKTWQAAPDIASLGFEVFKTWLGEEIPEEKLKAILSDALNFPVLLKTLQDDIYVLELFHGPTLSFKDFGARTMARLMSHFLAEEGRKVTILVATSGDTGSAVADGFAGQEAINVVLLYPKGMVSEVQERQLILKRPGVRALAVRGSFDDCQKLVKSAFVAEDLADIPLSSANSINIGRLLPQMLYYLWAVKDLAARGVERANICVPSGNLGNFTAGYLAWEMGLELGTFLIAHNANRFFPDYLKDKRQAYAFEATIPTLSNAMDVGAPSNFERLHHLFGDRLKEQLWSLSIDDASTKARILSTYQQEAYTICPHTAVGLEAIKHYRNESSDKRPSISLATAHPAKFPSALEALGIASPKDASLEKLFSAELAVTEISPDLTALTEILKS